MKPLRVFARHPSVRQIVIVAQSPQFGVLRRWVRRLKSKTKVSLVEGGAFRGASVRNGIRALEKCDVVLVHDSARPMVTSKIIRDVERAAIKDGVALAAWPLPDTLKKAKGARVEKTFPRENLWLAQTPQAFRFSIAQKCLTKPSETATDDVELAQRQGFRVTLVPAAATNMKVTYPNDLAICQKLI